MELIGEEGFEPSTLRFGNACSSPLSYKPFVKLKKNNRFVIPLMLTNLKFNKYLICLKLCDNAWLCEDLLFKPPKLKIIRKL